MTHRPWSPPAAQGRGLLVAEYGGSAQPLDDGGVRHGAPVDIGLGQIRPGVVGPGQGRIQGARRRALRSWHNFVERGSVGPDDSGALDESELLS